MGIAEPKKTFVDLLSEENITKLYKEENIPPRRMAEMLNVSVRTIYLIPFSHHVQVFYVVYDLCRLLRRDYSASPSVREKACYILLPVIYLIRWLVLFPT